MPDDTNTPPPAPPAAPAAAPAQPDANTQALINAAMEKARTEEKSKVFDRLNALEQKITALENTNKQLEAQNNTYKTQVADLTNTLTSLEKSKSDKGVVDTAKAVQEALTQLRNEFNQRLEQDKQAIAQQYEGRLKQTEQQVQEYNLERAKTAIIAELGGPAAVIPAMIVGTTVEEIRASAQRSAEIRKQVLADAGVTDTNTGLPASAAANGAPPPALNPSGAPAGVGRTAGPQLQSVKTMSTADYKKDRDKLQQESANIFQQAYARR